MRRILTALFLVVLLSTMVEAGPPDTSGIDDLTLGDLRGPKIPKLFHDGVMAGVFLAISGSKAIRCPMMSTTIMIAAIDTALEAKELGLHWRVYNAALYVLVRSGCTATLDPEPAAPQEKPNA